MAYHCGMSEKDFFNLYHPNQRGGSMSSDGRVFFRSNMGRQRGSGIGGIFGALARKLLPIAREYVIPFIAKHVFPQVKAFASNVVSDVSSNRNLMESVKEHGLKGLKDTAHQTIDQIGKGRKRKTPAKQRNAKKQKLDVFDPRRYKSS
jgi:hypothetical protein